MTQKEYPKNVKEKNKKERYGEVLLTRSLIWSLDIKEAISVETGTLNQCITMAFHKGKNEASLFSRHIYD